MHTTVITVIAQGAFSCNHVIWIRICPYSVYVTYTVTIVKLILENLYLQIDLFLFKKLSSAF